MTEHVSLHAEVDMVDDPDTQVWVDIAVAAVAVAAVLALERSHLVLDIRW